jgi:3'-5' exoribonuclease-like protein
MNYYFDTEFLDDGKTIDLISIGIVCEDGREYYAVSLDFDPSRATEWLKTRVLAHIPRDFRTKSRKVIADEVAAFIQAEQKMSGVILPKLWGWYPAYDWVALCQLYGPMIARPQHFPKRPDDLKQLVGSWRGPSQEGTKHNALEDARWVRDCHRAWLDRELAEARMEPGLFSGRRD